MTQFFRSKDVLARFAYEQLSNWERDSALTMTIKAEGSEGFSVTIATGESSVATETPTSSPAQPSISAEVQTSTPPNASVKPAADASLS